MNEPRLIRNSAKCLLCGDEIESKYRHDYRACSCGSLTVDGGLAYVRRGWSGSTDDWEDTSIYETPTKEEAS